MIQYPQLRNIAPVPMNSCCNANRMFPQPLSCVVRGPIVVPLCGADKPLTQGARKAQSALLFQILEINMIPSVFSFVSSLSFFVENICKVKPCLLIIAPKYLHKFQNKEVLSLMICVSRDRSEISGIGSSL